LKIKGFSLNKFSISFQFLVVTFSVIGSSFTFSVSVGIENIRNELTSSAKHFRHL